METFIRPEAPWMSRQKNSSEGKSLQEMVFFFSQGQGNFEFLLEVTIYEDSQVRELDFLNIADGFANLR